MLMIELIFCSLLLSFLSLIWMALVQALSLGIDGVGKLHRLKIPSCSLVRNLSSRSFSKLSVLNDVADIDCPFALEVKEDIDASSKRYLSCAFSGSVALIAICLPLNFHAYSCFLQLG